MFYSLVTFPQTSDIISSTSAIANPWFQEFLPYALFTLGIFVGFFLLRWFIGIIAHYMSKLAVSHEERESKNDWEWSRHMYKESNKKKVD